MTPAVKYIQPREAAKFLLEHYKIGAVQTLAKYRVVGGGPVFHRINRRVLYNEADLVAWATAKLSQISLSTSDQQKDSKTEPGLQEPADTAILADHA